MSDNIPLTVADLHELLRYIDADDRETWIEVGMGIKAEFGQLGFDAWDTWSQGAKSYSTRDAKTVWRSFRKSGTGLGTVIKLAMDNGWKPAQEEMPAEVKRKQAREAEARRKARQAEIEQDEARAALMREAVAQACQRIWAEQVKPEGKSAYLERKQVGAFGVGFFNHTVLLSIDDQAQRCDIWVGDESKRFLDAMPDPRPDHISFMMFKRGTLAVPLVDEAGKLWSLQAINPQGTKLFPKYGRKSGCFHVLGDIGPGEPFSIAEGYATAASVHMATGWPVAMAVDSGNMPAVARALRGYHPDSPIVMAGDDDPTVKGNPGRTKAEAAAREVRGMTGFPVLAEDAQGKDWNDLHIAQGLDVVREQLMAALASGPEEPDLSPALSEDEEAAADEEGVEGDSLNLNKLLRRYALIVGTTNVWDTDKARKMKRAAFEAHVGRELYKEWAAVVDSKRKKRISEEQVKEIEDARKMAGKKLDAMSMPPLIRYVFIDGTKDAWDCAKKRRLPEGALKMALGDAYNLWLNSAERRVVDVEQIVFDPTLTVDPKTHINTYEGLPLEPVRNPAACENLRWLVDFLCNHDEKAATWLKRWLAFPLQHSGAKMDTAVLMHSIIEGSGKSLLNSVVMGRIYGQYAATVGQTQLEGNFNAWQSGKLWAVFEEVVSRDQRYNQVGKIKQLITGQTVRIESKFVNGWEEASHMNAVFLSNEIMPWPISEGDRRFLVLWPEATLPEDRQKAIKHELANGGVEAFHGWLLDVDLGDFDPQTKPPVTPARDRLVALSRSTWQTFLHLWKVGDLGNGLWGPCLSSDLYGLFIEWCQKNKEHSMSHTKFSLFISAEVQKTRPIPWTDGNTRRFGAFFFPDDPASSPAPSLKAPQLGKAVVEWRDRAKLAGWNVDNWDHVKAVAA
ncbi:PriCT-2 domain-containing protein [Pseudomonas tohonis]|nr:hypothetical protein L682_11075 [Pseudomonas alcaligenes OT 69]MDN4148715.1 PriCT-2 domain-containing protein [Pseudomonas tohonis]